MTDVRPGPEFSTERPRVIGHLPTGILDIDVTPDFKRLIALAKDENSGTRSFTVVQNWTAALK